ncbi:WD repeat-containing protein 25-like [Uloborus diversus]|uniref:WD repeat-containing protein 25-like n=1 Tax=Uloborus diversus TaxID=327109 RepID=UPI00240A4CDC|nr:WD repeat-containing protein 25-like [Uloborus diversus]
MDLVASYDSEDSENEIVKSSNMEPSTKRIDIIHLDDSDNDEPKIITLNKKIDCIEIEESDSEGEVVVEKHIEAKANESTSKENKQFLSDAKSRDYLNLNDDSPEETIIPQNDVVDLRNSAAVLSDRVYGPSKSIQQCEQPCDTLSENRTISRSSVSRSSISSANFDRTISTPDSVRTSIYSPHVGVSENFDNESRKRLRTDNPEFLDFPDEPVPSDADIYRKDARVTEGYLKNLACRIPRQLMRTYVGHTSVVMALSWCVSQYSHLLLSASADCTIKIWDMFCTKPVRLFKNNSGLKAAKWSLDGEQVVAGGFGKKAHVYDVISGKEAASYDIFNYVTSIEIHPYMTDVLLCGTRNAILGFDLRVNSKLPIRTFFSKCEEVLDIAFIDENEFICTTNFVSRDSADRTIMVWHFGSGAILSNQIYLERYTCPSIKVHPNDSTFVAQSNGDYIASFSTCKPYQIRNKRYMGHKVSGYGIECDISPDGKYLASGDAHGDLYFYNYMNTSLIHKLSVKANVPTNRLKWHPALSSTIATATWDGHLQIWR